MEVKPGFKQTELGVIPEDWEVDYIGKQCSITTGKRNTQDSKATGIFPFFVRSQVVERINSYSYDGEAVLTAGDGVGTGKVVHYINGKFDFHQRVYCLSGFAQVLDGYYFYLFFKNRFLARIQQFTAKTSVDSVRLEMISKMPVALPPLSEQKHIAEVMQDIDSLITSLEKLVEKKRNIKQGVMQELITGKRRLPGYSEVWKTANLGELVSNRLVSLGRGSVISKKSIDTFKGDYPIYSSSIHNNGLFGCWDNYVFDEELITWSVDGGGNFFHRKKHRYSVTNVCGYMRVDQTRICYGFLYYQLTLAHSALEFDYTIKAHPSVIKKLYNVLLPTLTEQKAIYEFLNDIDDEINTLCNGLTKYKHLKQGMMQELLTGRIRLI